MPRSIGALTPAWFSSDRVKRAYYLKMVFAAPTGTLRWTTKQTYPATADARNIDGSVQNWDGTRDWNVSEIQEGTQTPLTISDLIFANTANEFSDLIYLSGGIRGVPMTVWCAGFNADPPHAYIDKIVLFNGEAERAEITDEVRVSLTPLKHPMMLKCPRRRFDLAHGFAWIPKPNTTITWGSNRYTPPPPSPQQTGGGDDPIPPPGGLDPGERGRPILVPPRGGTRTVPPRGGRGGTHEVPPR